MAVKRTIRVPGTRDAQPERFLLREHRTFLKLVSAPHGERR